MNFSDRFGYGPRSRLATAPWGAGTAGLTQAQLGSPTRASRPPLTRDPADAFESMRCAHIPDQNTTPRCHEPNSRFTSTSTSEVRSGAMLGPAVLAV